MAVLGSPGGGAGGCWWDVRAERHRAGARTGAQKAAFGAYQASRAQQRKLLSEHSNRTKEILHGKIRTKGVF